MTNGVSAAEFRELFDAVSNWGRWGADDQIGALNRLTGDRVAAAARLVRGGETVSLSLPLDTRPGEANPMPADHRMTMLYDDVGSGGVRFAKDYVGVDYHNDTHSHIDALCHVAFDDTLFNGRPSASTTPDGAQVSTIEVARNGIVGRGVLLDVPGLRELPWLEPGTSISADELELAARRQGVAVTEGDILLVRTGHARRLADLGPWDVAHEKAGLHPGAARFVAERGVAVLGSDGNSDTAPSITEGVGFPIHVLALNAMGVHLFDYLQLEELLSACQRMARWDFLIVAAPLRIVGGTGSPVNPIAIF